MIPYTGDRSILAGATALGSGITGASQSLADSLTKERERLQAKQDELDAFVGMGEFMTRNGQMTAEQLAEVSAMPVQKAKGYMTSLVADAARKQEAMTAEKLASIRAGGRDGNGIIYDRGRAYRLDEQGNAQPLVNSEPAPRMVPVVDPVTGEIRSMVPEGAIMGRSDTPAAERAPSEFTASTGERFVMGPQGQMVQIGKTAPAPSVGIGTVIPTAAGDLVVKGIGRDGMPETQLVQPDERALMAQKQLEQQRQTQIEAVAKARSEAAQYEAKDRSGNVRPGPDWLPIFQPYRERAAGKRAEADTLAAGLPAGRSTVAPRTLSPQDQQALDWANANPNDPRAAAIRQRLGM